MQHHIFMAATENNQGINNDQEQHLSQWNPRIEVKSRDDDSIKIQGSTQKIIGTASFITSHNTRDTK